MKPYEAQFAVSFGEDCHAFGFWKGRTALYAILKALNLTDSDEVIVPGYTCFVLANAVLYAGGRPIYADTSPGRYNLDPCSVEERLTAKTRALIVQHTYGMPADLASLRRIAEKHGLCLIEDCAHVLLGATHHGTLLGSVGNAAFFSFQWSKPYTTGLGGMVVTSDSRIAKRLRETQASFQMPPVYRQLQLQLQYSLYRRFFNPRLYWFSHKLLNVLSKLGVFVGSSNPSELHGKKPHDLRWKMSKFQQRLGLRQIKKLDENRRKRKAITHFYYDKFRERGWPLAERLVSPNINLVRLPVQVDNKAKLLASSRRAQVEIGSWFETPLHPLPLTKHPALGYKLGSCPNAENAARHVINLPLHSHVTIIEAERASNFVLAHASPAPAVADSKDNTLKDDSERPDPVQRMIETFRFYS